MKGINFTNPRFIVGIGLVILVVLSLVVFTSMNIYRSLNPYLDREILGTTTLTTEWLEITPKEPLQASRRVQQVTLVLEPYIKKDKNSWGIVLPDGSVVTLEVQIIDQYGNIYNLTAPEFISTPGTNKTIERSFGIYDLPQDRLYKAVRIRSSKSINVSRIIWRCYNPQDLK